MITRQPILARQPAWGKYESTAEAFLPTPEANLGLQYRKQMRYQLRYLI